MRRRCRTYEVDGRSVRVQGAEPLTPEGERALAELVRAAVKVHQAQLAAMTDDERERYECRQARALERITARNVRLRGVR